MNDSKVSVIIPVYNAESYLEKCLNSIMDQTYKNIEIIIVNDGSEDGSEKIIVSKMKEDTRIHYISKSNQGVSAARNEGISRAKGDYLVFIDADDYVDSQFISNLVSLINNTEMGTCGYCRINRFGEVAEKTDENLGYKELSREDFLVSLFQSEIYQGYIWNKIFITEIVKKYNIKFDVNIFYNEDRLFIFEYLLRISKVGCLGEPLYFYLENNSGAMGKLNDRITKKSLTEFDAFRQMLDKMETDSYIDGYAAAAFSMFTNALNMYQRSTGSIKKQVKKIVKESYRYILRSNIPKSRKLKMLIKQIAFTGI